MADKYKIRELSMLSGVPENALRFYEKYGILKPERGKGNYRYYSANDLYSITIARAYRGLGFSLKQCNELINQMDHVQQVEAMEQRLDELDAQIARLNSMRENLAIRIDEVEKARRLKKTFEVVTLQDSYWIFSHDDENRHVDNHRLKAQDLECLMQDMPCFRAEAHVPLECITQGAPYHCEWGNSTRREDYDLLSENDRSLLTLTPSHRYVVHTYMTRGSDEPIVLQDAFGEMKRYAVENGLRVEGDTALIRMLPGKREGNRFVYMQFLCYLPVV